MMMKTTMAIMLVIMMLMIRMEMSQSCQTELWLSAKDKYLEVEVCVG